jgi:hypothetical protein
MLTALLMAADGVWAFDESQYPDLKGQWRRAERGDIAGGFGGLRYDSTKPPLLGQEAPLTPEYQAIYEANLADQAAGGQGGETTYTCLSPGMPRVMLAYAPMEARFAHDQEGPAAQHRRRFRGRHPPRVRRPGLCAQGGERRARVPPGLHREAQAQLYRSLTW